MKQVVVWDPKQVYWEGAVVEEQHSRELAARGVVSLPCDPSIFKLAGFAGFAKRSWGSGWPLDTGRPEFCAPIATFSPGDPHRILHWAARLVPIGETTEATRTGVLRLAAGNSYWNQHRPVVSEAGQGARNVVEIASLGAPDSLGGWTVGGKALLSTPNPGLFGLGIYGYASGMRLAWLALTLTP